MFSQQTCLFAGCEGYGYRRLLGAFQERFEGFVHILDALRDGVYPLIETDERRVDGTGGVACVSCRLRLVP